MTVPRYAAPEVLPNGDIIIRRLDPRGERGRADRDPRRRHRDVTSSSMPLGRRSATGAFCPHGDFEIAGAASGPLHGLTFATKDIFDIAGRVTGCGNPDWLASHAPAANNAAAVQKLLDAGARMLGKTITDELAFSLNGQNFHYGTPRNAVTPERVPGGSSCGSASAVGHGIVDLALGSDTGGSVRIPACLNGIFGIRPDARCGGQHRRHAPGAQLRHRRLVRARCAHAPARRRRAAAARSSGRRTQPHLHRARCVRDRRPASCRCGARGDRQGGLAGRGGVRPRRRAGRPRRMAEALPPPAAARDLGRARRLGRIPQAPASARRSPSASPSPSRSPPRRKATTRNSAPVSPRISTACSGWTACC